MVSFNKFFTAVFLAIVYASTALATVTEVKHSTRRVREVANGLKVVSFYPESTYETFGRGIDHPLTNLPGSSIEHSTMSFIKSRLKANSISIKYRTGYSSEAAGHGYVTQDHDGIPFANAVANVAFNRHNKVVAFGSSFVKPKKIASSKPTISLDAAIATAEKALDGNFSGHPATIEYLVKDNGSVVLTHVVQIQNDAARTWYLAFVDAHSGDLASIVDFVSQASYLVVPIMEQALTQRFRTLIDPQDTIASPYGWHSHGNSTIATDGNNIIAFKSLKNLTTKQSSAPLNFIYPQNAFTDPTTPANVNAARVNAFYVGNVMHDILHRYGFTEPAFNFQTNNFKEGGAQHDRVTISVQEEGGTNNAYFAALPDGQNGIMGIFLWTRPSPHRDGALDNDIIVHEYTHGITNRMTGGGTSSCLQSFEAAALGEGWSDAMAEWAQHTSSAVPDYAFGKYVSNRPSGLRTHLYSTSALVNPLRYSSIKDIEETRIHRIGEVWANMLHNVYASLVAARGWSPSAHTNPGGREGNIVFLHLFIDALALQPCNPTFVSARAAWIQADANRYAGANRCTLWKAFASRGLGIGAARFTDSSVIPSDC